MSTEPDLTRKERREQARSERRALEQTEREQAAQRQRFTQIAGALIVIVVVGVIVALVAGSGSKKVSSASSSVSSSGSEAGLIATPAPWAPQYNGLLQRVSGNHFPPQSDTGYHVHSVLRIYVEGKPVPVPSQIGIDQQDEYLAPLHTHDASGIVHMEATEPYPFTLAQFFTVWGVKFSDSQLGAYKVAGPNVLALYVNGEKVASPTKYTIKPHDRMVLDYGNPKSFVKEFAFTFPSGL